jgi:hypothetical protein
VFLCETPDLISDCIYDLRAVSSKFVERVTCFHSLISASSSRSFSVTNFRASGPRRLQTVSGIVYENIDGADLVLNLRDHRRPFLIIGYIENPCERLPRNLVVEPLSGFLISCVSRALDPASAQETEDRNRRGDAAGRPLEGYRS